MPSELEYATPHHLLDQTEAYSNLGVLKSLRVISFNVWFSEQNQRIRAVKLFEILHAADAHIIFLQVAICTIILNHEIVKPIYFNENEYHLLCFIRK